MNIEIHNNPGTLAQMVNAAETAKTAATGETPKVLKGNDKGLTVSEGTNAAAVESVPDSALDRSDPLGKLISTAFNLPPPAIPVELT
jgi:hypothetical protein